MNTVLQKPLKLVLATSFLIGVSFPLSAAPSDDNSYEDRGDRDVREDREGRRGPPPVAIDACTGLAQDASCSFEGRRGVVEGQCFTPAVDDMPLACRPNKRSKKHVSKRKPE